MKGFEFLEEHSCFDSKEENKYGTEYRYSIGGFIHILNETYGCNEGKEAVYWSFMQDVYERYGFEEIIKKAQDVAGKMYPRIK